MDEIMAVRPLPTVSTPKSLVRMNKMAGFSYFWIFLSRSAGESGMSWPGP
jgi:hypothetical protein